MYNEIVNKIKFLESQNKLKRMGEGLDFVIKGDLIKISKLKANKCTSCKCTNSQDNKTLYIIDDGGADIMCLCEECLLKSLELENFDEFIEL